jgi:hypothetical protein
MRLTIDVRKRRDQALEPHQLRNIIDVWRLTPEGLFQIVAEESTRLAVAAGLVNILEIARHCRPPPLCAMSTRQIRTRQWARNAITVRWA